MPLVIGSSFEYEPTKSQTLYETYEPSQTLLKEKKSGKQKVTIDISGKTFETYVDTLARFPDTLLGDVDRRGEYEENGTVYFDRNRQGSR